MAVDEERVEGKNLYQKGTSLSGRWGDTFSHYLGKADGGETGTQEEKETK